MTTALVTGANKGLGLETARGLLAAGHDVWIGARDPARGKAAADALGAHLVALDVTDQASVDAAVTRIAAAGGLDVLVNNAGIANESPPTDTDLDAALAMFATNVVGVLRVTQAFVPLLERSARPVVVNVSSALGSLGRSSQPDTHEGAYAPIAYAASKAALNLATLKLARALPAARVNAVTPGLTATDLNDHRGTRTAAEGARVIVRAALLGPDGPTGTFFDAEGPVAW